MGFPFMAQKTYSREIQSSRRNQAKLSSAKSGGLYWRLVETLPGLEDAFMAWLAVPVKRGPASLSDSA
jgi:hypothetical protein